MRLVWERNLTSLHQLLVYFIPSKTWNGYTLLFENDRCKWSLWFIVWTFTWSGGKCPVMDSNQVPRNTTPTPRYWELISRFQAGFMYGLGLCSDFTPASYNSGKFSVSVRKYCGNAFDVPAMKCCNVWVPIRTSVPSCSANKTYLLSCRCLWSW
jgi:hypothetical protein